MDIDTVLDNLRALVELADGGLDPEYALDVLAEMCESFTALDGWMSNNGFRPDAWLQ